MRIEDYAKYVQAMQKAGEQMMKEVRRRRMNTPPSFSSGGYVRGSELSKYLFVGQRLRTDLTTAQKMKAFKFIRAIETAKEL